MVIIMQNTNEYIIDNQKIIIERNFDENSADLIEVLMKYFLEQQKSNVKE